MKTTIEELLACLEAQAIYIVRETFLKFEHPILLFSGGKDSLVLSHIVQTALGNSSHKIKHVYIDTGDNFDEMNHFIAAFAANLPGKFERILLPQTNEICSKNRKQSIALKEYIANNEIKAALGGSRRDEDIARSKEKIFSLRNSIGQWDPYHQRQEYWNHLNYMIPQNHSLRVFPLSNWTEKDVWNYIKFNRIEIPKIYFSHTRNCLIGPDGDIVDSNLKTRKVFGWQEMELKVRCRTIGDTMSTALLKSDAQTIDQIIDELNSSSTSERHTRLDDRFSPHSMEIRKSEGYF